jgi:hypothetical protein
MGSSLIFVARLTCFIMINMINTIKHCNNTQWFESTTNGETRIVDRPVLARGGEIRQAQPHFRLRFSVPSIYGIKPVISIL